MSIIISDSQLKDMIFELARNNPVYEIDKNPDGAVDWAFGVIIDRLRRQFLEGEIRDEASIMVEADWRGDDP